MEDPPTFDGFPTPNSFSDDPLYGVSDSVLYTRLTRVPDRFFYPFGARGVGKSTWVRSALPDALRLDLLDGTLFTDLLADPSLFRDLVSRWGRGK